MDPLEREDSSTYVSDRPVQPVGPVPERPAEQPPRQSEPTKKKSKTTAVLAGLLALALIAAAVLGWLWYQESARADAAEADLATTKKNFSELTKSVNESQTKAEDSTTVDTSDSDSEAIVETALAYEMAQAKPLSGVKAVVSYNKDDFAKVNITSTTTSHYQILKKSNDQWVVIASGNGPLPEETITQYGIPQDATK